MENVSEPDVPLESRDDVLSTGEILFPNSTSTPTLWGSNNPYILSLPSSHATSPSEPAPTLPAPALNLLSEIFSPGEPAPTLPAPALNLLSEIFSPLTDSPPLLPSTPQLSPTLSSESMEMVSPLEIDDSNSALPYMVSYQPEESQFADPGSPLISCAINSEEDDGDLDGDSDDAESYDAESEAGNSATSSDLADSINPSLLSLSSPEHSSGSSPTSDTFNPYACNLPDCGINFPHDIGPFVYAGSLPNLACEPYPWGDSRPPPGVFMAHWLVTILHKPTSWRDYSIFRWPYDESPMERENRDLVANFMAHHGWWGETVDDETGDFHHWDEYENWFSFRAWREQRRAGLAHEA